MHRNRDEFVTTPNSSPGTRYWSLGVEPDWQKLWTGDEGEIELEDFEFRGPGWYFTGTDSLLVMPAWQISMPWDSQEWPREKDYWYMVYNNRDPRLALAAALSAPIRKVPK